jgi:hypothetical protein
MRHLTPIVLALPLLAACASVPEAGGSPAGTCDAGAVQALLGELASAEMGALLLEASGARTLRWAPPRSALTMDYRPDRLTVGYDDAMIITEATCG